MKNRYCLHIACRTYKFCSRLFLRKVFCMSDGFFGERGSTTCDGTESFSDSVLSASPVSPVASTNSAECPTIAYSLSHSFSEAPKWAPHKVYWMLLPKLALYTAKHFTALCSNSCPQHSLLFGSPQRDIRKNCTRNLCAYGGHFRVGLFEPSGDSGLSGQTKCCL